MSVNLQKLGNGTGLTQNSRAFGVAKSEPSHYPTDLERAVNTRGPTGDSSEAVLPGRLG